MGSDKSKLVYHQHPQFIHSAHLLAPFCHEVYLSCNQEQYAEFASTGFRTLVDAEAYAGNGPMTALMTAFDQFPDRSFLVLGCDYPFVTREAINRIVQARDIQVDVICYKNSQQLDEPLIALYEHNIKAELNRSWRHSEFGLRYLMNKVRTLRLTPSNEQVLQSKDMPG